MSLSVEGQAIRKPNFIRRAIPESNSEQISTNTNNTSNTPRKQPSNAVTFNKRPQSE
jgi:hypothetical protein